MRAGELSSAERQVWEAFSRGEAVDLRTGDSELDAPDRDSAWGPDRTVRARVLTDLLLGRGEAEPGHVARLALAGARIEGRLDLGDAEITVPVALTECRFDDGVTIANARARRWDFSGSWLASLDATQAHIDGDLLLRRSRIPGGVRLAGARLVGMLLLNHAWLGESGGYALHAARLVIDHSIYCVRFRADGGLYLAGARVGGGVHCPGARLSNRDGDALEISRATIDDDLNLTEGFQLDGFLRLVQTHVRGQIDMSGAQLNNLAGPALIADNLTVDQSFYAANLVADAELRLLGAHVAGDFVLSGARLRNPGGQVLDGGSLVVDRGMRCGPGFVAEGELRLVGSKVGVLDLCAAEPVSLSVDLRHAQLGILRHDPPAAALTMRLDGLTYDTLDPLLSVPDRLTWLAGQPDGYRPLPYEQLAGTYRRLGHDADARKVLLAKQRRRRAASSFPARAWGVLQDWTVGYGYLPGRAALWLLALLTVGTILFWLQPPLRVQAGTGFNALVYTLDVLLPVVRLGQATAFTPAGSGLQWCGYLLTAAGWVLATTVVAGITRTLTRH
ncbi:hypothetical protein BAY61_26130 [Prauserella marina]|uniref:Uncharacterized protein n=1 Tax=Prauserella marina TaxID=530584 RepID=A0A222VW15_9PSEU|nr:hypothetical protein [Prauserella marina]ASR37911.1 hypothetical protein BAY61_26130 [Prauserella marina]PWV73116.1 hypothetical protein DES30_10965 [Prauserella marina]SDD71454.1 hypothetical protein SAMN05421630_111208 [Prauserella marina]